MPHEKEIRESPENDLQLERAALRRAFLDARRVLDWNEIVRVLAESPLVGVNEPGRDEIRKPSVWE